MDRQQESLPDRGAAPSDDTGWRDLALCREVDPELWFPSKGGTTAPAKAVCRRCPVQTECLEYALEHDERYGIYGGLSERQRRRLKQAAA